MNTVISSAVGIDAQDARLQADVHIPPAAAALVVFAHGSASNRQSPRNLFVARALHARGIATLLVDLLTEEEERVDQATRQHRFDIGLLAPRLISAARWVDMQDALHGLPLGLFGASTGSAAALLAAASLKQRIGAVVSRGGRPDLVLSALPGVQAPTLLIVGGHDPDVLALNEKAMHALHCEKQLRVVPGASHLFEEAGALDAVARLSCDWFGQHLGEAAP